MSMKKMTDDLKAKVAVNLHKIFDTISDGITICDPDGTFLMVNRAQCQILQVPEEGLIGKKPKQLIEKGLYNKSLVAEVVKTKTEAYDILKGRFVEVMSRCRPIFDEKGEVQLIVATVTNMMELNQLKEIIKRERRQSEIYLREIQHLRQILLLDSDFVCESTSMKSILESVKKVAPMNCTVFITGESGVGKEVIAKIIHTNSAQKNAPFIPVSIPAVPENLMEAELFGYEEGAFTGAAKGGKIGFFELAQNGTLFLDEVGDIPSNLQVKILRALETREITRVGGTKPIKLNVRIITATNKDMKLAIRSGSFREDLYYRLNVIPLKIEPLRERREDIWPLCSYFITKLNEKYNMNKELSVEVLDELKNYNWPGNVRELKNVVERLAILSTNDLITKDDAKSLLGSLYADERSSDSIWLDFKSFEKKKILETLKQTNGNKSKTAKILGISRSKLYRKLCSGAIDE